MWDFLSQWAVSGGDFGKITTSPGFPGYSGGVFDKIARGFVEPHMEIVLRGELLPQNHVNHHTNVFGGRVQVSEFLGVEIEVFVVEAPLDLLFDQVGQPAQIDHHARIRVDFTRHFYFQFIIVPVPVGVVAQAEHFTVALIRPRRVVQPVCGIEMGAANDGDFHLMSEWVNG